MIKHRDLHAADMANDPAYPAAYDALAGEFELASALIRARTHAKLTQAEVAARMGTTESAVSRLESGRVEPSTRTLEPFAAATGHRIRIAFEPVP